MGYRTDVGLCLTGNGKKILEARLSELEADTDRIRHIQELLNDPRDKRADQESGAVAWLWKCPQWYMYYKGMAFIENVLCDMEAEDYLFIRVGESNEDNVVHGGFYDNPFGMYLVREIAFE